jgi:hypothetical protein
MSRIYKNNSLFCPHQSRSPNRAYEPTVGQLGWRALRPECRPEVVPSAAPTGQPQLAVSPQDAGCQGAGRGILVVRGQPCVTGLRHGSLGRAPVEISGDRIVASATVDRSGMNVRPASATEHRWAAYGFSQSDFPQSVGILLPLKFSAYDSRTVQELRNAPLFPFCATLPPIRFQIVVCPRTGLVG